MKRYANPEAQRYVYYIRETINGYAIQVLVVDRDERYPLTAAIAAQNGLDVPEGVSFHASSIDTVEASLAALATANGMVEIE